MPIATMTESDAGLAVDVDSVSVQQALGGFIDRRADLFSLGVMLWEF